MNKIDTDKLKDFITKDYGTLKNFAYHLGVNYQSFNDTLHSNGDKKFNKTFYIKIIKKLNDGKIIDNFCIKPLNKIEESYFEKK